MGPSMFGWRNPIVRAWCGGSASGGRPPSSCSTAGPVNFLRITPDFVLVYIKRAIDISSTSRGTIDLMREILDAILAGARGAELEGLPLPESFRGAAVRRDEVELFSGIPSSEKDPRKSIHLDEVALPEMAPDECIVAVMASAINFNTVWTSIFEPLPTFLFLERLGRESVWGKRHDLPYHILGSDASGVVLRVGSAVRNWKPGDRVTVHCNYVDDQDPSAHDDSMLAV